MAGSTNLTAITTNLGTYAREHRDDIFSNALLGLDDLFTKSGITLMDDVQDEVPLPNFIINDIVRPGKHTTFDPTDDAIEWDNRMMKVRPFKVDLLIYPQDYERTHLAHNRIGRTTMKDWEDVPFHVYLMDQILAKVKANLRKATWQGVYNANGTGVNDICDGFVKKILDDVAASNIDTVSTGSITTSNVIGKLEAITEGLGDALSEEAGSLFVPRKVWDMYIKADPSAIGRYMLINEVPGTNPQDMNTVYLRGTNIKLVKEPHLTFGSTSQIICTTKNNFFAGTDSMSEFNNIEFEKFNRSIKMMIDGKWGVEYALANTEYAPIVVSDAFV